MLPRISNNISGKLEKCISSFINYNITYYRRGKPFPSSLLSALGGLIIKLTD